MVIVKVLKRKDGATVVVAVLLAMIVSQLVMALPSHLSAWLSGLSNGQYLGYGGPGQGWKGEYLYPFVNTVLELITLEVLAWVYLLGSAPFRKAKK